MDEAVRLFVLNLGSWSPSQREYLQANPAFPQCWSSEHSNSGPSRTDPELAGVLAILQSKYALTALCQLEHLAKLTGMLPLAIVQCASFLRQYNMCFQDYVEKFTAKRRDARERFYRHSARGSGYNESVMTIWEVSFDRIA
jgi:hypothetical protein